MNLKDEILFLPNTHIINSMTRSLLLKRKIQTKPSEPFKNALSVSLSYWIQSKRSQLMAIVLNFAKLELTIHFLPS